MSSDKNIVDIDSYRSEENESIREAARASAWWDGDWLKFPTVSQDAEGGWHYWDVPADSGVYAEDWPLGERLARETIEQMRRFPEGSTVLRRILREMDPESNVGQGFLTGIEDTLCRGGELVIPRI